MKIKTKEDAIKWAKMHNQTRHRCALCNQLSYFTNKINGSPWVCYDGCFSVKGFDSRTIDGKPVWLGGNPKGKMEFGLLV